MILQMDEASRLALANNLADGALILAGIVVTILAIIILCATIKSFWRR